MSIVHRPLARSLFKALAFTAMLHAALAALPVPSFLRLASTSGHPAAKNTRPVVLAPMPASYIPILQLPKRKLFA